jgi:hypothetical protein
MLSGLMSRCTTSTECSDQRASRRLSQPAILRDSIKKTPV